MPDNVLTAGDIALNITAFSYVERKLMLKNKFLHYIILYYISYHVILIIYHIILYMKRY